MCGEGRGKGGVRRMVETGKNVYLPRLTGENVYLPWLRAMSCDDVEQSLGNHFSVISITTHQ